jgi:hypothetical protein
VDWVGLSGVGCVRRCRSGGTAPACIGTVMATESCADGDGGSGGGGVLIGQLRATGRLVMVEGIPRSGRDARVASSGGDLAKGQR